MLEELKKEEMCGRQRVEMIRLVLLFFPQTWTVKFKHQQYDGDLSPFSARTSAAMNGELLLF